MLVKARLPDLSGKLLSNLMGKPALDALGAALDRLVERRSQQHMQMLWHDDEPMQLVASLIPIVEERLYQQFGIFRPHEQGMPLIRRSGEGVGFHGR
jgi:hypothetical protein